MPKGNENKFSLRMQVSVLLIAFAAFAWVIPDRHRSAEELQPEQMMDFLKSTGNMYPVDAVARIVVNDNPAYRLVDIRSAEEYLDAHIPGAINIPVKDILNPDWSGYLDDPWITAILYSNGTILAAEMLTLCVQSGYENVGAMHGGMNEWFRVIMESKFTGERISAAENARFEVIYRAREDFNTINSLPDSLKSVYLEVKMKKEAELVGGCE